MSRTSKPNQLVLLLHGIRTRAWWQGALSAFLERETGATVIPIKYGRFDLIRFLLPFRFSKKSTVLRIERSIEDALHQYPHSEVTIIAHSFGTYALSEILINNPRIRLRRVVLCGAIIRKNFPWDRLYSQFSEISKRKTIINECGLRDVWPLAAESLTWGYGASGVDGFGTVGVRDRYHDLGHSAFLSEEFARKYWVPLINDDVVAIPDIEAVGGHPNKFLNLLRLPYRYFIAATLIGATIAVSLPMAESFLRQESNFTVEPGLAAFEAPTRSLMMYAAAPGGFSYEQNTVDQKTSPFSYAIHQALRDGATDVNFIASKVQDNVAAQTDGRQIPHYENSLGVSLNLADNNFNKIALVVGNSAYEHVANLETPSADVLSISRSLREVGFATFIATDVSHLEFKKSIEVAKHFANSSDKPTIVVFYYAGHGVQVDNISYMIPVDANISSKSQVLEQTVSVDSVVDALMNSADYTLILLDACRDDPFVDYAASR